MGESVDLASQIEEIRLQYQMNQTLQADLEQRLAVARLELDELQDTRRVLRLISDRINKSHSVIQNLGTIALQETFPQENLALCLEQILYKGKPGIEIKFHDRKRDVIDDPEEAAGGGPASLMGIILRILTVVRQPQLERVLILDEPLTKFSGSYISRAARLLRKLCEPVEKGGLGFHMLVITHNPVLREAAHRSYYASALEKDSSLVISQRVSGNALEGSES